MKAKLRYDALVSNTASRFEIAAREMAKGRATSVVFDPKNGKLELVRATDQLAVSSTRTVLVR
jgi:hypothetical protein